MLSLADVFVLRLRRGLVALQILPVANAGHQLDAPQVSKPEYRRTLRLGIAVQRIRLNVGIILGQSVQNVDRFPHTARNEIREQGDVIVTGWP